MNNIYDNGMCLVGDFEKVYSLTKKYYEQGNEELEEALADLEDYKNSGEKIDIVYINYDSNMFYDIKVWTKRDLLED